MHLTLPLLLLLVPAAGGLIATSMITRTAAFVTTVITAITQLVFLGISLKYLDGGSDLWQPTFDSRAWFPFWNINFSIAISRETLALIALVTIVTLCASVFAWHVDRERPAPFQGLLWLAAAGMCGLFLARDLVLFYVFFEVMLIPLLFLVGSWGGEQRVRAALTMFIYTLVGSLLMLVGVIGVGATAGSFDMVELGAAASAGNLELPTWAFLTFVIAFAVKAPLMPLHGWLPITYRESPAEVTAVLSGLVSKAAMWGFLAVVLPLFPAQMEGGWGTALTWLCIVSLLYGSITAFRQPDARGVVAYSSLAQMGLIVLGLSVYMGEGGSQGVSGAYMQAINHGLISAALFLIIGLIEVRAGSGLLSRLGGLATGRPVLATIVLIVGLCALAVPGSNAFAGELLILVGVFQGDWTHAWIWAAIASGAIVLAAMYALRLVSALMHTEHSPDDQPVNVGGDLRAAELVAVLPLVACILALSVWPNALKSAMNHRSIPIAKPAPEETIAVAAPQDGDESDEHAATEEHQ